MDAKLWLKENLSEIVILTIAAIVIGGTLWYVDWSLPGAATKATVVVALIVTLGSFATFWLTKAKERKLQVRQRKEERYKIMIESLRGYIKNERNQDKALENFITQYNLLYLYAPDTIIKLAREFLNSVEKGKKIETDKINKILTKLINEMRKDIGLKPTTLLFKPIVPVYKNR